MTDESTTTTTEWGVEYRWPDGHVETEWYDSRRFAEMMARTTIGDPHRRETADIVYRTVTRTEPVHVKSRSLIFEVPAIPVPTFNLAPVDEDDPTVVVPASQFERAPQ